MSGLVPSGVSWVVCLEATVSPPSRYTMLLLSASAALAFAPSASSPLRLPRLLSVQATSYAPTMLLDAGATQWLSDAAILMPDGAAGAATAAATAAAEADPGWFDLCAPGVPHQPVLLPGNVSAPP